MITTFKWLGASIFVAILFTLTLLQAQTQELAKPKYTVRINDEKTIVADIDDSGAIDPTRRINFQPQGNFFANITTLKGETLQRSHFPQFMINGRVFQPGQGGRFEVMNAPLKSAPGARKRIGSMTVWTLNDLRITQTMELHP